MFFNGWGCVLLSSIDVCCYYASCLTVIWNKDNDNQYQWIGNITTIYVHGLWATVVPCFSKEAYPACFGWFSYSIIWLAWQQIWMWNLNGTVMSVLCSKWKLQFHPHPKHRAYWLLWKRSVIPSSLWFDLRFSSRPLRSL